MELVCATKLSNSFLMSRIVSRFWAGGELGGVREIENWLGVDSMPVASRISEGLLGEWSSISQQ